MRYVQADVQPGAGPQRHRRFCAIGSCAALLLMALHAGAHPAPAVQEEAPATSQPPPERPAGRPHPGRGAFDADAFEAAFLSLNPLVPAPEDRGPPREGEAAELLAFARENLPRLATLLDRLAVHNPHEFRSHLPRLVPRLRQMKRIYEMDADMGQLVAEHAAGHFQLQMYRRAWRSAGEARRALLERTVRTVLATQVRVEAAVMEKWSDILAARPDEWRHKRLEALLDHDPPPAPLPPRIRILLHEYRSTADAARKEEIRARLEEAMRVRFERRIQMMRQRANDLRTNATAEVDIRLEHFLRGDHPPPPPGPPPAEGAPPPHRRR